MPSPLVIIYWLFVTQYLLYRREGLLSSSNSSEQLADVCYSQCCEDVEAHYRVSVKTGYELKKKRAWMSVLCSASLTGSATLGIMAILPC